MDVLYSVMQSVEAKIGGGEGIEGIYGSITRTGMAKVADCLHHNCGLGPSSTLVDVGAGLCRPLLHALLHPGIAGSFGIEVDPVKCQKAEAFIHQTTGALAARGVSLRAGSAPVVQCTAVEKVVSLDPATHAYSFWEGVPQPGKAAFGRLFSASSTLRAVAVVQRSMRKVPPSVVMRELGFGPLLLVSTFPVTMSGSGRKFVAYIFSKIPQASLDFLHSAECPPPPTPAQPPLLRSSPEDSASSADAHPGHERASTSATAQAASPSKREQPPTMAGSAAASAESPPKRAKPPAAPAAARPAEAPTGQPAAVGTAPPQPPQLQPAAVAAPRHRLQQSSITSTYTLRRRPGRALQWSAELAVPAAGQLATAPPSRKPEAAIQAAARTSGSRAAETVLLPPTRLRRQAAAAPGSGSKAAPTSALPGSALSAEPSAAPSALLSAALRAGGGV